jgi:hypothetical protein
MKFVFIFSWAIGIFGLLVAISTFISGEDRLLLTSFQNPVLRYALPLMFLNMSAVLLLYPLLVKRGIVIFDYSRADKYMRAKSTFILLSLTAPGWLLLFVAVNSVSESSKPLFILVGIVSLVYLSSIVTLLKLNK